MLSIIQVGGKIVIYSSISVFIFEADLDVRSSFCFLFFFLLNCSEEWSWLLSGS